VVDSSELAIEWPPLSAALLALSLLQFPIEPLLINGGRGDPKKGGEALISNPTSDCIA